MKRSVGRSVMATAIAGLFSAGMNGAHSAGFALIENSASGMGNAYAGGSAIADDTSTVWFNPAGMTRIKGSQIAVAGHLISPDAKFKNNGSSQNVQVGEHIFLR